MTWALQNLSGIISATATLLAIMAGFWSIERWLRRRRATLESATKALEEHSLALREFLENPDAPTQMKEAILSYSHAVTSEASRNILLTLLTGPGPEVDRKDIILARLMLRRYERLRRSRPDLAKAFHKAVITGTVFWVGRWSDRRPDRMMLAALRLSDDENEVAMVTKTQRLQNEYVAAHPRLDLPRAAADGRIAA